MDYIKAKSELKAYIDRLTASLEKYASTPGAKQSEIDRRNKGIKIIVDFYNATEVEFGKYNSKVDALQNITIDEPELIAPKPLGYTATLVKHGLDSIHIDKEQMRNAHLMNVMNDLPDLFT